MNDLTKYVGFVLGFWFLSLHLVAGLLLLKSTATSKIRLIRALFFNSTNFSLLIWISVCLLSLENMMNHYLTVWMSLALFVCLAFSIFMLFCHTIAMGNVIQMIKEGDIFHEN